MLFSHGTTRSKGVLILFSSDLQIDIKNVQGDSEGRYIFVEALVQDTPFLFVNLYTPTERCEQCPFFDRFAEALENMNADPNSQIIIGGDFNTHLDPILDNLGGRIESKPSVKKINEIMTAMDLIDIWRIRNPEKKQYAWTQKKPLIRRRLDYWLISTEIQDDITEANIIPAIKSDHSAITLTINSLDKQPFGPSHWKFNSSLLDDASYIHLITSKFADWLNEFKDVNDKRVLWDLIKCRIRQVSVKYSKEKARERRARLVEAEQKVTQCDLICNTDPSEKNIYNLETAKYEYELLYDYIVRGNIVRSKINWYENGEKNSKYFLNLETTRSSKTAVRRLFDSKGKITVNPQAIMNELKSYYQNLFSSRDHVHFTYNWRKRQELNFDAVLKSISKTLKGWKWRNLTLYGKIQVVKSFVIPKFMFRASLICLSKDRKQANSVIYKFIWKGTDKIKRLAIISDYKNGGLRMPHIETLIDTHRIMCLKKYSQDYISPWKHILSFFL